MSEPRLFPRLVVVMISVVVVVSVALYIQPAKPTSMTIGTFAEKETPHDSTRYRITNAGGGKRSGHFLVFEQSLSTRYHVVMKFDGTIPKDKSVFIGRFEGVIREKIPECPCDPPFLLLSNVTPETAMD